MRQIFRNFHTVTQLQVVRISLFFSAKRILSKFIIMIGKEWPHLLLFLTWSSPSFTMWIFVTHSIKYHTHHTDHYQQKNIVSLSTATVIYSLFSQNWLRYSLQLWGHLLWRLVNFCMIVQVCQAGQLCNLPK